MNKYLNLIDKEEILVNIGSCYYMTHQKEENNVSFLQQQIKVNH